MFARHLYRNQLVRNDRWRRDQFYQIIQSVDSTLAGLYADVQDIEEAIEVIRGDIKKKNQSNRGKQNYPPDQHTIESLKRVRKQKFDQIKPRKQAVTQTVAHQLEDLNEQVKQLDKEAREAEHDLYDYHGYYGRTSINRAWGNYVAVNKDLQDRRSGAPNHIKRWDGNGSFSIQIQGGMPVEQIHNPENRWIYLEPVPDHAFTVRSRALKKTKLWFRVESGEKGRPVWGCIPISYHRPLPSGMKIKWLDIYKIRIGRRVEWEVQFSVEKTQNAQWPEKPTANTGLAGMDVGWRKKRNGDMRVAYIMGDDGQCEELVLPHKLLSKFTYAKELQSQVDKNFDMERSRLYNFIKHHDVPQWLTDATCHINKWKNPAKLDWIVSQWSDDRFSGDETVFQALRDWQSQHRHLFQLAQDIRRRAIAWRKQIFRDFAAEWAAKYRLIRVEDINWSRLRENPRPEDGDKENVTGENSNHAAVGELLEWCKYRFAAWESINPVWTTQYCRYCNSLELFDKASQMNHQCSQCGRTWDQDWMGAWNVMTGMAQPPAEGANPPGSP
jgi:hypothetical protein